MKWNQFLDSAYTRIAVESKVELSFPDTQDDLDSSTQKDGRCHSCVQENHFFPAKTSLKLQFNML